MDKVEWILQRADRLIVGDVVQDLGTVEAVTTIDNGKLEIEMRHPSRGGTMRRWHARQAVRVKAA